MRRVVSRRNGDGRFTVDLRDYGDIHDAFNRILGVLERAERVLRPIPKQSVLRL